MKQVNKQKLKQKRKALNKCLPKIFGQLCTKTFQKVTVLPHFLVMYHISIPYAFSPNSLTLLRPAELASMS